MVGCMASIASAHALSHALAHLRQPFHHPLQDDELAGRRRRARAEGESEDEEAGGDEGLAWPSPGSDDEAEDEELLRRAKQGQLLAESQGLEEEGLGSGGSGALAASGSGGIPLDEGSQEVLGLLARCGSEPQLGPSGGSGPLPRSRLGPAGASGLLASFGSDPSNSRMPVGGGLSRGPSFVGRQPSVQRVASSSGLGVGGRSFVFGRDDSNSALPDKVGWGAVCGEAAGNFRYMCGVAADCSQLPLAICHEQLQAGALCLPLPILIQAGKGSEEAGTGSGEGSGGAPTGPTSFANLRQMAGMPPAGQQQQQQRKRAGASLVSRLAPPAHRKGKEAQQGNGGSAAAAAAAVAVMASSGRMKK